MNQLFRPFLQELIENHTVIYKEGFNENYRRINIEVFVFLFSDLLSFLFQFCFWFLWIFVECEFSYS